ncbi:MAG: DUF1318 domain-containing protein [Marinicella sp.]|nr:YdbL family protein [Xanthomonadales bacterium]
MSVKIKPLLLTSFLFVAACVTINVYFPAAEVESAAEKIVKDVLSSEETPSTDDQSNINEASMIRTIVHYGNPLNWLISSAQAQVDITISSPAISALTDKMKQRYSSSLKTHLENNVVGFNNKGFVEIVDAGQLGLKERQDLKKTVADENRDREALYREMAIANNHPEWEDKITEAFIKQWIEQAQKGWSYQDSNDQWVTKLESNNNQ